MDMDRFNSVETAVEHLKVGRGHVLARRPWEGQKFPGAEVVLGRIANPLSGRVSYMTGIWEDYELTQVQYFTGADSVTRAWEDYGDR